LDARVIFEKIATVVQPWLVAVGGRKTVGETNVNFRGLIVPLLVERGIYFGGVGVHASVIPGCNVVAHTQSTVLAVMRGQGEVEAVLVTPNAITQVVRA
jgi:hypothetical protein